MAYFRKRSGKWSYTVDIGIDPVTGKRKQRTRSGFLTKKAAQLEAAQIEQEISDGLYVNESNKYFQHVAEEWFDFYKLKVKISSARIREKEMNHLIKAFKHLKIRSITKKNYIEFIHYLANQYKPNYVSGIHTTGKMIFQYAIDCGYVKVNPSDRIELPKPKINIESLESQTEEIKFLEKEELARFLKTAYSEGLAMDYLAFSTLSYTGLRIGELLALKWTDIDFKNRTLRVTKTLYNPNNNQQNYELLSPKTNGSIRTIKIDKQLLELLKKHKDLQTEHKLKHKKYYHDNGFIFAREDGHPQLRKVFETRLKRILKKAHITKNITPHSFRHTHTSLLIEAGVGIKEIQQRLGHSDIQTTMNIYAHITKNMEENASIQFSKLMSEVLNNQETKT